MQPINFSRKQKAFTLIELVMVVVITGMMAIFVYPNYTKTVNKSYEKNGSSNLLIMYSAQKLRFNNGDGYVAAANVAAVNTNLNLGIIANGFTYSCTLPTVTTFRCEALRSDASFTLRITDDNSTVCCTVAGACPTAPTCS